MKKIVSFVLAFQLISGAYADPQEETNPPATHSKILLGMTTGFSLTQLAQPKMEATINGVKYVLSPVSTWKNNAFLALLIGAEFPLQNEWKWQPILEYRLPTSYTVGGELDRQATRAHYPTAYRYDITTSQLMLETKCLRLVSERYYPYALFGLGSSFNQLSHFEQTSRPGDPPADISFSSNSQISLTYVLGVGVDIALLKDRLRLGLGYRFADFGSVKSGAFHYNYPPNNTFKPLGQNHLLNQEFLLQLTGFI